jgi:hypothetical protein
MGKPMVIIYSDILFQLLKLGKLFSKLLMTLSKTSTWFGDDVLRWAQMVPEPRRVQVKELLKPLHWKQNQLADMHREALTIWSVPEALKWVLVEAVTFVSSLKGQQMNAQRFPRLWKKMGSDYTQLLSDSEVRWFSCGEVLIRLFQLL